jgi:putative alpha-1,2-mannosidase
LAWFSLGPDTITGGDNAPGYSWEHTTIKGFSFTRMSGVGWYGDFGNLLIMPTTGDFKPTCGRASHPGEAGVRDTTMRMRSQSVAITTG